MRVFFMEIPIKDLQFGVHRPASWWVKHPKAKQMQEKMRKSIQKEGLRNPLTVTMQKGKYTVEVGNQRLQALKDLQANTVPCIVCSTEKIQGKEIMYFKELETLFKDGIAPFKHITSVTPKNHAKWDGEVLYAYN